MRTRTAAHARAAVRAGGYASQTCENQKNHQRPGPRARVLPLCAARAYNVGRGGRGYTSTCAAAAAGGAAARRQAGACVPTLSHAPAGRHGSGSTPCASCAPRSVCCSGAALFRAAVAPTTTMVSSEHSSRC
ncbi:hypothetical protein EON67_10840, partial [archaeon]